MKTTFHILSDDPQLKLSLGIFPEPDARTFRRWRLVFNDLVYAVEQLRSDTEVFVKLSRKMAAWYSPVGDLCFFELYSSGSSWRLCSCQVTEHDIPKRLRSGWGRQKRKGAQWGNERFELNFAPWELSIVAGPDLVTFVESFFSDCDPKDIFRWPVFDTGRYTYPYYERSLGAQEIDEVIRMIRGSSALTRFQALNDLEKAHCGALQ